MSRLERALADVVLGHDGGWAFWIAGLVALEELCRESRSSGRARFEDYPEGELRRLKVAVGDALERAALAVELRDCWIANIDAKTVDEHRRDILDVLHGRAAALADARSYQPS